jgi:hypothetical protein
MVEYPKTYVEGPYMPRKTDGRTMTHILGAMPRRKITAAATRSETVKRGRLMAGFLAPRYPYRGIKATPTAPLKVIAREYISPPPISRAATGSTRDAPEDTKMDATTTTYTAITEVIFFPDGFA